MRFRASLVHEQLIAFTNHMRTVGDVSKMCYLRLSRERVRTLSITDEDTLMTYTAIDTPSMFAEFLIESNMRNEISVEVSLANLLHALKAAAAAHSAVIKLTKRADYPYLAVLAQEVEGGVRVEQEVPVRLLGLPEMERFSEPSLPKPTVRCTVLIGERFRCALRSVGLQTQLCVPNPRALHPILDRLRSLSKTVRVEEDMSASTLTLSAKADTVTMTTFMRGLERGAADLDESAVEAISVSSRGFSKVLKACGGLSCEMTACIVRGFLLLHFPTEQQSFTFLLSAMEADD